MHDVLNRENSKLLQLSDGEIIYDGFKRHGMDLPHGCLAGSCGACRIQVLSGAEHLSAVSAVEKNTLENLQNYLNHKYGEDFCQNKTIRLSCRTKVYGSCEFQPIK